jgi:hypothetical protein
MQKKLLGLVCASVLVIILIAGLWPFHSPKSQVTWLSNGDGLHFGKYGVMLGPEAPNSSALRDGAACSVEIWLQPDHGDTGGTVLAFYARESHSVPFSVHQSIDDLLFQRVTVDQRRRVSTKLYIEHAFRKSQQLFVTITSNAQGATVYVNGVLVRTSPRFGLSSKDLTGQLVVGNHPMVENGWQGQLRGLAIYDRELTSAQVMQHYNAWTTNQNAEIGNEGPVALYLLNERRGDVVHSQMNSGRDLRIPERFVVLQPPFLKLPWDEFRPSLDYCTDLLINIGGFVPLGFFFCAYFTSVRRLNRAVLITIVLGGVVSFTIEVLQSFLPTRDSGITDIITNTLGTGIGAMFYASEWVQSLCATIGLGGPRRRVCKSI